MPRARIEGSVSDGFEPVKQRFEKIFRQGREDCSQLCVYVGTEKVVDLWGSADGDATYGPDTLQTVFSSTKNLTAIAAACMVDRGLLDYGEKVSKYWPEFAQKGKDDVKVEDVLRHECGLPHFDHSWKEDAFWPENLKKNEVGKVIEEAEQKFPPESAGTKREYHGVTRGLIMNEIFRRVEPQGRTLGEFLREEVCGPLGADAVVGASKDDLERYKALTGPTVGQVLVHSLVPKAISRKVEVSMSTMLKALSMMKKGGAGESEKPRQPLVESWPEKPKPDKTGELVDTPALRRGEISSMNGGCSARGLAKLAACMVNGGELDGVRIMSEEAVEKLHAEPVAALDHMFRMVTHMTRGGVGLMKFDETDDPLWREMKSQREGFVGWMGYGGSVFMWHPELKIGFGYAPSRSNWYDFRNLKGGELQSVVLECVRKKKNL